MKSTQQLSSAFLLLASSSVAIVDAFASRSSFTGVPTTSVTSSHATIRMDLEVDTTTDYTTRYNLDQLIQENRKAGMSLDDAQKVHGMPWKDSIDPKVEDDELLYMPFWEWQMSFMKENLTNLRVLPSSNGETDFGYKENAKKKARIVNLCASSAEYRKIRMTYYDAGDNTQVFNSVWYPDPRYNLPVLGIDLLAFNRKKYLAIVDFQPLHDDEADHAAKYEHLLEPIKKSYDSLKGQMSSKFYDETKFFSKQMLFARFEDEGVVEKDLFPAFASYVETHLNLIRETEANPEEVSSVMERQEAYDTYSAERDPATGLFAAMFGGEWANDFVYDFLFSLSEKQEHDPSKVPAMPFMGGGGPPPKAQQQQSAQRPPQTQTQPQRQPAPAFVGAR